MKNLNLGLAILLFMTSSLAMATNRCAPPSAAEPVIYNSDFSWNMDLAGLRQLFTLFYSNPKRLFQRASYDEGEQKYYLAMQSSQGGRAELPASFIDSVTQHIQKAFERKLIDGIFFPDMGHSHFLVPTKKYDREYADIPVSQMNHLYEKMFKDTEVKVVYHTAEQLKLTGADGLPLPDRQIQWRYYTRNLVGDNAGEKKIEVYSAIDQSPANTLSEVEGYRWWGAGFNLSANQQGCFSYKVNGKEYFYDISLSDLPSDPNQALQ